MYGDVPYVEERHRHRFEVNPEMVSKFEEKGMMFVGRDDDGKRMEIMELKDHPFFVAVQYHPEFLSRPMRPSPPFYGESACGCLRLFLVERPPLVPRRHCNPFSSLPPLYYFLLPPSPSSCSTCAHPASSPSPGFILAASGQLSTYLAQRPNTPAFPIHPTTGSPSPLSQANGLQNVPRPKAEHDASGVSAAVNMSPAHSEAAVTTL